jgi:hypothetical protein
MQGYSDVTDATERFAIRKCSNDKVECESLPVTSSVNSVNFLYGGLNDNMSGRDGDESDSEAFRVRRRSTVHVKQASDDVRICFPEQQVISLSPYFIEPSLCYIGSLILRIN